MYSLPKGSRYYRRNFFPRQFLPSVKEVEYISNAFCIGKQIALISQSGILYLNSSTVCIIGRNFSVMNNRTIQQGKRMGPAPPTGSVGRIATVRCPTVACILIKTVEFPNIFRVSNTFEYPHVFSTGKNIRSVDMSIDFLYAPKDIFLFIQL